LLPLRNLFLGGVLGFVDAAVSKLYAKDDCGGVASVVRGVCGGSEVVTGMLSDGVETDASIESAPCILLHELLSILLCFS